MEVKFGNSASKSPRNRGSIMLVYTVLTPNSRPQVRKPTISSATFRIIVIADSGSGTKLDSTIPRPEMLLTDAWLGARKKNTAAAMMATAPVRISPSRRISMKSGFLFIVSCPSKIPIFQPFHIITSRGKTQAAAGRSVENP